MLIHRISVDSTAVAVRLDLFLTRYFIERAAENTFSRSWVQKMIAEGQVTLNGRKSKPSARLTFGDIVEVRWIAPKDSSLCPEWIPLDILYEDEDCIVINKAPGMLVHPAGGRRGGTLVNALLYHCPALEGIGGERRPGIVHRLDKDTSGVMVVAKRAYAFQNLAQQFKARRVKKEYLAVVWGKMDGVKGVIDRPIGRHRTDRKKMSSIRSVPKAKEAVTEWCVEESYDVGHGQSGPVWVTLLRLKPRTGRTHQIRVHLADCGHPLVGDKIYRHRHIPENRYMELSDLVYFPRQALHAARLGFMHPGTGLDVEFHAPVCLDLDRLLDYLRQGGWSKKRKKTKKGVDKEIVFSYY
jgi:23S rRNA pseudouridine1911/1915/1917 synthase